MVVGLLRGGLGGRRLFCWEGRLEGGLWMRIVICAQYEIWSWKDHCEVQLSVYLCIVWVVESCRREVGGITVWARCSGEEVSGWKGNMAS